MTISFAKILKASEHYAAHGQNASIVIRTSYADPMRSDPNAKKQTTICLRRGRDNDREAVQLEITIETIGKARTTRKDASISLDQQTWDAIVKHVRANRTIAR
jgi:hypothetical protein